MREGPYAKITAISGILVLLITYLTLAYTAKWLPFQHHVSPVAKAGSASNASGKRSDPLDGVWVAQLASVPISAGDSKLQKMLAEVRQEIPGAHYLDSSLYASLHSGYWLIYYRSSFSNGNEALTFCAAHGRDIRNQCIGRFVSHRKSDRIYMCFPPADTQGQDCYRNS
jgi:eukaryotic-like serine/threonine-protein kinase